MWQIVTESTCPALRVQVKPYQDFLKLLMAVKCYVSSCFHNQMRKPLFLKQFCHSWFQYFVCEHCLGCLFLFSSNWLNCIKNKGTGLLENSNYLEIYFEDRFNAVCCMQALEKMCCPHQIHDCV